MFNEFWQVYPRKEGKKKAQRLFDRLTSIQQRKAIEDCQTRYSGIERCFIPLPTTYLNGERWEDDPIPRKKQDPEIKVSHASHRLWKPE